MRTIVIWWWCINGVTMCELQGRDKQNIHCHVVPGGANDHEAMMERWEEAEGEEEEESFQKEGKWGGRKSERGEEGEGFVRTRNASTTPAPVPCWTPDTCNRWAFTLSLSLTSQNMEPDLKFSTVSFHWYNNDLFWFNFHWNSFSIYVKCWLLKNEI